MREFYSSKKIINQSFHGVNIFKKNNVLFLIFNDYIQIMTKYTPNPNRYNSMPYRRVGKSGLKLPAISLGMWHNFGSNDDYENWARLDKEFKIRLQQYNNRMINNKLYIKR